MSLPCVVVLLFVHPSTCLVQLVFNCSSWFECAGACAGQHPACECSGGLQRQIWSTWNYQGDFSDLALSFPSAVVWGLYIQATEVICSILQGHQIVTFFFFNGQKYVYLFGKLEVAHNAILVFCFSSVSWNLKTLQIPSSTYRVRSKFSREVQGDRAAS